MNTTPTSQVSVAPSEVTQPTVSSQSQAHRFLAQADQHPRTIVINGVTYSANVTQIVYRLHASEATNCYRGSLIDRGANGGLSGNDVRVMSSSTSQFVDVQGIADANVNHVPLSTVAGVIQTSSGPIVGIFHQYAHYGEGHTLHSPLQLEAFGITINDHNIVSKPGTQHAVTLEGYHVPFNVSNGLVYMPMHPPSDDELSTLPHVTFTSDSTWDPSAYDCTGSTPENDFSSTSGHTY